MAEIIGGVLTALSVIKAAKKVLHGLKDCAKVTELLKETEMYVLPLRRSNNLGAMASLSACVMLAHTRTTAS